MKLVTFQRGPDAAEETGLLTPGGVLPVKEAGLPYDSMNDLIARITPDEWSALRAAKGPGLPLGEVRLLAPIPRPRQDVLCLGLNYAEHAREAGQYSQEAFTADKTWPVFFSKRVTYAPGPGAVIPAHEDLTDRLDYEAELAVILGRDAKNVPEKDAADYIFGYTILNDVSARDLQTRHKQWYFGKSLDGFTPMGPCLLTADSVPFPPRLAISTTVNGELRQDAGTGDLIHGIPEIIATLSRGMTLAAGTIIATGTPKGVAMGMETPRFLKKGDVVVCRIEAIGELPNTVG